MGDPEVVSLIPLADANLRLDANAVDYALLAFYFVVVLTIGYLARRQVSTSLDFFLSGRSLPTWVTGLAFIAANLGAIEVLAAAGFAVWAWLRPLRVPTDEE